MPVDSGYVRSQPDILKGLIRIGAVECIPTILNFVGKRKAVATTIQFTEVQLDTTAPTPIPEGSTFTPAPPNTRTDYVNATQIFKKDYQITGTALAVVPDHKENVVAEEKLQAMRELQLKLAKKMYAANPPTLTSPREMAGLEYYTPTTGGHRQTVSVPTGDDLELHAEEIRRAIRDASLAIANQGCQANMISMGASVKAGFNAMGGSATRFFDINRNELNDVISVYHGEFGVLYGYYDIGIGADEKAFIWKKEDIKLEELRPFKTVKIAQNGDAVNFEIVGEYSMSCKPHHLGLVVINRV